MSLRWAASIALKPLCPKTQNGRFQSKSALLTKKVCYTVSLCKNRQRHSCKAFILLSLSAKMVGGDVPFYVKIWPKLTHPLQKRWLPINIRSAVTPSNRNSINPNGKSATRFPMSLRWIVHVVPNPPLQRKAKKSKVAFFSRFIRPKFKE